MSLTVTSMVNSIYRAIPMDNIAVGMRIMIRDGDLLVPLSDDWTTQSIIYAVGDGSNIKYIQALWGQKGEGPNLAPIEQIDPKTVFVKPRRNTTHYEDYKLVENMSARILNARQDGHQKLSTMADEIIRESGLAEEFVSCSLRLLVAQGGMIAVKPDQGRQTVSLRLSPEARLLERRRAYATSFAHDLSLQAERIGQLVGHGPTIGGYREELFRSLLQRHLPKRYHAATGFVDGCPNQIDILIYDQMDYTVFFREGDLVVVPPAAIRALIEVKSNLTSKELTDALKHLEEARPPRLDGPPVFTGIFAYDGASVGTLSSAIKEFHRQQTDDDSITGKIDFHLIDDVGQMVDAVCVLQNSILLSSFSPIALGRGPSLTPSIIRPVSRTGVRFEAALFFDYLIRFLRHPSDSKLTEIGMGPFLDDDSVIATEYLIYGQQSWGPYMEEDCVDPFEARFKALENWLSGGSWSDQPA